MNRYPLWKYLLIGLTLFFGMVYTLPNFFGEVPAVQISSGKATLKIDASMTQRVNDILQGANITPRAVQFDQSSVKVRLEDPDQQIKAKDALESALNPTREDSDYVVALNLLAASPAWLTSLNALPMYLGLDLRGGVHFLLQVDLKQAANKRLDSIASDLRTLLREKKIRHSGVQREGNTIAIRFKDDEQRRKAADAIASQLPDLQVDEAPGDSGETKLTTALRPAAEKKGLDQAIKQNIQTLSNRINELGVAEPIIQQQGPDRVIVQLPGVQDTAKAKNILGRTATLEVRMVDDSTEAATALAQGTVPFGLERFTERGGGPLLLKRQVILTGENLTDAQAGFDSQSQEAAVHLTLDSKGARIFRDVTRENIGKRMAILLVEKGKGEVVTAPVIRSEISGGRVQISGRMTTIEAADVALLLRAGSLAAPMEIIEERTIGPSLGKENIAKGFNSTLFGFALISAFMVIYYALFGAFSVIALSTNLLLLVAVLSLLQATLTLPGIAAIALTLGMAIDANVLINERIREELRNGSSPQAAIAAGFDRAWATILDSNITTLIAGLALLAFGSGAIRGFAVVHCLGILTSIFSSVFVSRGIANLWYGRRKRIEKLAIGQVWRPDTHQ